MNVTIYKVSMKGIWDNKINDSFRNLLKLNGFVLKSDETGRQRTVKAKGFHGNHIGARPNQVGVKYDVFTGFPQTVLAFAKEEDHLHPTQKPVALLEYMIKTYTNEGETVLDFTAGSGSTGVACANTDRKFIGIELDDKYFDIAKSRVLEALIKVESNNENS